MKNNGLQKSDKMKKTIYVEKWIKPNADNGFN